MAIEYAPAIIGAGLIGFDAWMLYRANKNLNTPEKTYENTISYNSK